MSSRTTAATFTQGRAQTPFSTLVTGDYIWKPEVSPAGPVVIIVSVPEQVLYVYRNGVQIGRAQRGAPASPATQRQPGFSRFLQKEVHHRSNLYHGAPDALHAWAVEQLPSLLVDARFIPKPFRHSYEHHR